MFESLTKKLSGVFERLGLKNKISEGDVRDALREIKIALLEADVALDVAKEILARVEDKAVGSARLKGVDAASQIIKIVSDELEAMLGGGEARDIAAARVILMVGLNGGGKTTTSAKLAKLLCEKHGKKVLLASLDAYRPQAKEQLATLAERAGAAALAAADEKPLATLKRALAAAKDYDALILDSAGRTGVDEELMSELRAIAKEARPDEVLLAVDALTGQDSVNIARAFNGAVPLTGIIMTRAEGDARGGAAISMKHAAGAPVRFVGVGEKLDDLEVFHADRMASKILGMGDIVSLVEKAEGQISEDEAKAMAEKMFSGDFTLSDMLAQMRQMKKLGSISGIVKFIPGLGGMAEKLAAAGVNDDMMKRQEAIILSMTPRERQAPELVLASRKKRIAAGAGVAVAEVEKLLKNFEKSRAMMARVRQMGGMEGLMEMMKNTPQG